jgi:hypothetical protein
MTNKIRLLRPATRTRTRSARTGSQSTSPRGGGQGASGRVLSVKEVCGGADVVARITRR